MKAISFINTMLNSEYRVYVSQQFNFNMIEINFQYWMMKDMIGWQKFVNPESNIIIEFYGHGNPYKIKNPNLINGSEFILSYPNSLEDFICDCERCFVDLNWNQKIIDSMDRIYFMKQSNISEYNKNLLLKIEKS